MKDPSLAEYAGKRNFKRTAEPRPGRVKRERPDGPLFVIQKHAARRLHYDFRLEIGGALASWAVPKGPPLRHGDRRLAMRVEDHPLDYARFEGTIAPGNYGAGTVMVWDIGTFAVTDGDAATALADGKLNLILQGKKLRGEWTLVRMKQTEPSGKEAWLLLKRGAELGLPKGSDDESALSGRSMDKIARDLDAEWVSNRASSQAAKAAPPPKKKRASRPGPKPGFIEPMKALLRRNPPETEGWSYEIKFDGIRALAIKQGKEVTLFSRLGHDITARYPRIAGAMAGLQSEEAVVDGEVVALEKSGKSSFQLLQRAGMAGAKAPICYYVFDVLRLDGRDLTARPLHERKELLHAALPEGDGPVRFSESLHGEPRQLLAEAGRLGLEGLIGKKDDSVYEPGRRSGSWIKLKVVQQQEFVIGGYTPPGGAREHFGSILAGYYQDGQLRFASKVGTGFDQAELKGLLAKFKSLARKECPFDDLPRRRSLGEAGLTASEMKKCHWIEPRLVCEVVFQEWTRDGRLRQPVYAGLRDDKKPQEVIREKPDEV